LDGVLSLAVSPTDGLLAVGGADPNVRIYNMLGQQAEERGLLKGHSASVTALAFSPRNAMLATGGGLTDKTLRLWSKYGSEFRERHALRGHNGAVTAIAFAHDGLLVASGGSDGSLTFWDLSTAKPQLRPSSTKHLGAVTSAVFTPDGKALITADAAGRLMALSHTGSVLRSLTLPGPIHGVAVAPDSRHVAVANGNGTAYIIRLWTAKDKQNTP
jgi:WD40 repeat protein